MTTTADICCRVCGRHPSTWGDQGGVIYGAGSAFCRAHDPGWDHRNDGQMTLGLDQVEELAEADKDARRARRLDGAGDSASADPVSAFVLAEHLDPCEPSW